MSGQSEEDVWRAIVENYGERPQLDPVQPEEPEAPTPPRPPPPPVAPALHDEADAELDEATADRFVPPPPPPLPHPPPVRLAAWLGLFGSPVVLLFSLSWGSPCRRCSATP